MKTKSNKSSLSLQYLNNILFLSNFNPRRLFLYKPKTMAGMFKCLSVTEGNVALGPEVQFL